jgi:hypothetical protein
MLTSEKRTQNLTLWLVRAQGADKEYGTHLTFDFVLNVHGDKENYHAYESSQTREGVNLPEEPINSEAQLDG